jgi:hypothetical protein
VHQTTDGNPANGRNGDGLGTRKGKGKSSGANPHSGAYDDDPEHAAKNAADLEAYSHFESAYRDGGEDIPHTRNNWLCYDFKERRIVPEHEAIRSFHYDPCWEHLKPWVVETSADGESWKMIDHSEDNHEIAALHAKWNRVFAVARVVECRFIRPVKIDRTHRGSDQFHIVGWEVFRTIID